MKYRRAKKKFVRKRVYEFEISDGDGCRITKTRDTVKFSYFQKTVLFKQLWEKSNYGFVWLFWYYRGIAKKHDLWFSYQLKVLT